MNIEMSKQLQELNEIVTKSEKKLVKGNLATKTYVLKQTEKMGSDWLLFFLRVHFSKSLDS